MHTEEIIPLKTFIADLDERLQTARESDSPQLIETFLESAPLSVFIPSRFGGRGQEVHECLTLLETCSYHSLPLSLIAGINGALFLQPLSRSGDDALQASIFRRFMEQKAMGGLMITEPEYGSDALSMRTSFTRERDGYRLRGTKHWGGLTGRADCWLLTARGAGPDGELERNINFFVWDKDLGGIEVEEYYQSLGLEMISYGRNRIDTHIPESRRLLPQGSGVRMLLDLLHRSRLQFPGMAMGFLKRLLDEAWAHVRRRMVGGRPLSGYDQVQSRLAELQAAYTTCSAMCVYGSTAASIENDCSPLALAANSIKSVVTDLMQAASQSLVQLMGAQGYRKDHIAGASLVDSRPFQIFEGSNDILYEQIADGVLKSMRRAKESNLFRFLGGFELSSRVAERVGRILDFQLEENISQRKKVDLGRILGRIFSAQMVIDLGERGFRKELIENCIMSLQRQIAGIIGSFHAATQSSMVDEYAEGSQWADFIPV